MAVVKVKRVLTLEYDVPYVTDQSRLDEQNKELSDVLSDMGTSLTELNSNLDNLQVETYSIHSFRVED
jgi:hypothetical protein